MPTNRQRIIDDSLFEVYVEMILTILFIIITLEGLLIKVKCFNWPDKCLITNDFSGPDYFFGNILQFS